MKEEEENEAMTRVRIFYRTTSHPISPIQTPYPTPSLSHIQPPLPPLPTLHLPFKFPLQALPLQVLHLTNA